MLRIVLMMIIVYVCTPILCELAADAGRFLRTQLRSKLQFPLFNAFVSSLTLNVFAAVANGMNPLEGETKMILLLGHLYYLTLEAHTAYECAARYLATPSFFSRYRAQLLYQFGASLFHSTAYVIVELFIVWLSFAWQNVNRPTLFWCGLTMHSVAMKMLQGLIYGSRMPFATFAMFPALMMALFFMALFVAYATVEGDGIMPRLPAFLFSLVHLITLVPLFAASRVQLPIVGVIWLFEWRLIVLETIVQCVFLLTARNTARFGAFYFFFAVSVASVLPKLFSFALDAMDDVRRLSGATSSPNIEFSDFINSV
ncbi:hypothetical protein PMAYCL1PPCAC_30636 [Pristionchus mayeri]|uniref:Uncharacterized protein n=1 Tax=Pristionchus mayeri TaxID=1317129 RepID=A0AAN5DBJ7_9BILA|nr:hypothetical protein PMAYCL1PPCAC_30636 [Pristionchus mayeri]